MSSFRFLHAADIHLDSPLTGLSRYEGLPADEIRSATRAAFGNLIQFGLDAAVDFVIVAGDLFDGDWRDMATGLHFARQMGPLEKAGIPVYLLMGNHDAASVVTKSLPWPSNVHRFGSRSPQTFRLEESGVALHGWSFAHQAAPDNLAARYPAAVTGMFNIGVLHTSLSGRPGHGAYAAESARLRLLDDQAEAAGLRTNQERSRSEDAGYRSTATLGDWHARLEAIGVPALEPSRARSWLSDRAAALEAGEAARRSFSQAAADASRRDDARLRLAALLPNFHDDGIIATILAEAERRLGVAQTR